MEKQTKSTRFCLICNYVSRYVHRLLICWFITDSGTLFLGRFCLKKQNVNIVICLSTKLLRVLKHLFKRVQAFLITLEFSSEEREKPKYLGFMQAMRLQTKLYGWKAFPFDRECLWMESALGVRFENCHRKHLAVFWSKLEVHWQNWSCWPSHQTNWTCYGPVLLMVQTCITCFFLDTCHTLPWPKTSQAQIWNQNIRSCQCPASIFDLLSAFLSCSFPSSLGHPTWYFSQP